MNIYHWFSKKPAAEKPNVGLILPGGGARGAYQVGVLKAIEELLPTVDYKRDSIQHLGEMGAAAAPLIEVIVQDLNSDEIDIRELAVTALGKIGPAAKSTIPAIKRLLASDESDVLIRQAAELAISRIEAEPSN